MISVKKHTIIYNVFGRYADFFDSKDSYKLLVPRYGSIAIDCQNGQIRKPCFARTTLSFSSGR